MMIKIVDIRCIQREIIFIWLNILKESLVGIDKYSIFVKRNQKQSYDNDTNRRIVQGISGASGSDNR